MALGAYLAGVGTVAAALGVGFGTATYFYNVGPVQKTPPNAYAQRVSAPPTITVVPTRTEHSTPPLNAAHSSREPVQSAAVDNTSSNTPARVPPVGAIRADTAPAGAALVPVNKPATVAAAPAEPRHDAIAALLASNASAPEPALNRHEPNVAPKTNVAQATEPAAAQDTTGTIHKSTKKSVAESRKASKDAKPVTKRLAVKQHDQNKARRGQSRQDDDAEMESVRRWVGRIPVEEAPPRARGLFSSLFGRD